MTKSTFTTRIEFVDLFKAVGIILMIIGHICMTVGFADYSRDFDKWFHAFHMPMFFFISGYLFKHRYSWQLSFLDFVKKKSWSLLLPYVAFGLIHFAFYCHLYGFSWQPLIAMATLKNATDFPIAGALWFLPTLFFIEIIYFCLDRYCQSVVKAGAVLILSLVGIRFNALFPGLSTYIIGPVCVGIGFFACGHFFHDHEQNKLCQLAANLSPLPCLLILLVVAKIILVSTAVNIRLGTYDNYFVFWFNALVTIICIFNLCRYCEKLTSRPDFIYRFLLAIGQDSITYVCLNQLLIFYTHNWVNLLPAVVVNFFGQSNLILIMTLLAIYVINLILTKTKLSILIGKRRWR